MSGRDEYVVLINPAAGSRAVSSTEVSDALSAARVRHVVQQVDGGPEQMREAVIEVIGSGRRLAVVGGDGTVALTVDALTGAGLAHDAPPLAVLPSGTGCDLLRMFGIPQDLYAAARHLATDSEYRIDAAYLDGAWGRRVFVNVAETGAGAAAAETALGLSRRLGKAKYPIAFAARLAGFPAARVRVEGKRVHEGRALAVILANAQFFAGGWNVAPKALIVDGELDVQVIDVRKREAPSLVPKIIKGVHLAHPGVRRWSDAEVRVSTDVVWPVEADGDFIGHTPFTAGVIPQAISLKI